MEEICHVCIVVSNMERSLKFYRDTLGFSVIWDNKVKNPNFSTGVGLKDIEARVVLMQLNKENTLLELFEYQSPKGRTLGALSPNDVPATHIAFKLKGIQKRYEELKNKGVEFISEPQKLSDDVYFCYFRDPDGALLEFIEFPENK